MAKSLWAAIADISNRGGRPTVTLPRACEVIEPRRPVGRPRLHPVGTKRGHGYNLVTGSGRPMRCRARGCSRTLKKSATSICCSRACELVLRSECESYLEVLDGKVDPRHLSPTLCALNKKMRLDSRTAGCPRPHNVVALRRSAIGRCEHLRRPYPESDDEGT
jgi:hypothetical protein